MKHDILNLIVLLLLIILLFATSLLLDLQWVQRFFVRQLLVYLLMALELFIGYKNLKEINKN